MICFNFILRLKQLAEKEAFVQAALHEASKPVARFRDDADLDAAQREMDREGDPMLKFIKRKKEKQQSKGPGGNLTLLLLLSTH